MRRISVVIPCYNHGEYVGAAVQSVLNQSYPACEITIVNDGSTDTYTNELLNSFNKEKCRVITTKNQGLAAARNNGIKVSTGEYICCLDADDKYHPEFFQKAVELLGQDEGHRYGIITAWVQFFGTNDIIWKTVGHNVAGFESYFQGVRNNVHSSSMFRKSCWERAGGFDETMTVGYEDWDFWLKIFSQGDECFCIEEPLIYYRQKEESMVTRADDVRPQLLEKIYRKHCDFYVKNLVPILLERDWEVQHLQAKNNTLTSLLQGNNLEANRSLKGVTFQFYRVVVMRLRKFFSFSR